MIDKQLGESEIFENYESSPYLTALYGLITQIRYQRQPYIEVKVLVESDMESEITLATMLMVDNKHS